MIRIALATCEYHPGFVAGDDEALLEAFAKVPIDAQRVRWDDAGIDWSEFDCVVLRTTWDYHKRLGEFLAWCERVSAQTLLLNPLEVVRSNSRKTYLRDLERDDVPIVPTRWIEPGAGDARKVLQGLLDSSDQKTAIAKPVVGAAADGLLKVTPDNLDGAIAHIESLLSAGTVMAQEWIGSITSTGETSVVVIDGEVTHAVRKVPAPGDFRVQIELGGHYTLIEPTPAQKDIALRAFESQATGCLYARVDLVEHAPNEPCIIELELIEPELFFPLVDAPRTTFVRALMARLERELRVSAQSEGN